jgi:hypothetical protein
MLLLVLHTVSLLPCWSAKYLKRKLNAFCGKVIHILSSLLLCRFNGSYAGLDGGNLADALVDFTGGVAEMIQLRDEASMLLFKVINFYLSDLTA